MSRASKVLAMLEDDAAPMPADAPAGVDAELSNAELNDPPADKGAELAGCLDDLAGCCGEMEDGELKDKMMGCLDKLKGAVSDMMPAAPAMEEPAPEEEPAAEPEAEA